MVVGKHWRNCIVEFNTPLTSSLLLLPLLSKERHANTGSRFFPAMDDILPQNCLQRQRYIMLQKNFSLCIWKKIIINYHSPPAIHFSYVEDSLKPYILIILRGARHLFLKRRQLSPLPVQVREAIKKPKN